MYVFLSTDIDFIHLTPLSELGSCPSHQPEVLGSGFIHSLIPDMPLHTSRYPQHAYSQFHVNHLSTSQVLVILYS